ncbi:argonaute 1 [Irineochytrium annulatum]|nr:argonaute 1 [Irineochytrium annulatum]
MHWIQNVDWSSDDNFKMPMLQPSSSYDIRLGYPTHTRHKSLPPAVPSLSRTKLSLPRPNTIAEDLASLSLKSPPSLSSSPSLAQYGFPTPTAANAAAAANAMVVARRGSRKRIIARPTNPGSGTRGVPIRVLTNFYSIEWPEDLEAHHYDVKILPETVSRVNKRVIQAWKEQNHGTPEILTTIFDGTRNLFSLSRLPFVNDELTVQVMLFDEENGRRRVQRFTLRMRRSTEIRMDRLAQFAEGKNLELPRDAIMILEVLLRQRPSSIFTTIGRGGGSFYSEHHNTPIANGLTVHQGWYQSIRPTFKKLLLNLDVSATSFYIAGPLIDSVAKFFNKPNIDAVRQHFSDPHERKRLERFLRDVAIEIRYRTTGRKRYRIKAITDKPASQTLIVTGPERFKRIIPIVSYFQEMYGVALMYPWLPCVISGANSDCILPIELCWIRRNQRHVGKLNDQQLADIVKLTAVMPEYRKERVVEGMRQLHGYGDSDALESWGVRVNPEMSVIEARILTPPPLTFGAASELGPIMTPVDGTWRIGRGLKFAMPAVLTTWAVAVFGDPAYFPLHTVGMFIKNVLTACVNLGMEISERNIADFIVYAPGRMGPETVEATLRAADERARSHHAVHQYGGMVGYAPPAVAQLVICIMAQKNTVYETIKKVAETEMGLMTQCVIGKHVHVTKPSYAQNLALKINAKLGGVNSYIDPIRELGGLGTNGIPTMLMGADVTHPQHGAADLSSIGAVVGTVDKRFCEYRAAIRVQSSRREILSDLEGMTKELLEMFRFRNGLYPRRILFFRDGVGEAQLGDVSVEEISAVKRACVALGIEVRLTFLIVNKRHHGRFFPGRMEVGESDGKGNILAGTVIDSGVTHPFEFDFYLTSHPGMQGTSKAAHYHVLHDDNNFSADDLQEITYRLCYNFARSTRAVSIVPPAYFAHLVAARARCYASSAASPTVVGNSSSNGNAAAAAAAAAASSWNSWSATPNVSSPISTFWAPPNAANLIGPGVSMNMNGGSLPGTSMQQEWLANGGVVGANGAGTWNSHPSPVISRNLSAGQAGHPSQQQQQQPGLFSPTMQAQQHPHVNHHQQHMGNGSGSMSQSSSMGSLSGISSPPMGQMQGQMQGQGHGQAPTIIRMGSSSRMREHARVVPSLQSTMFFT